MHARRLLRFRDGKIQRSRSDEFAVRARGVEMRVIRDDVAFLAHYTEQDAFRGAALVRGNHVPESEDALHGIAKSREARRTAVRFVAAHCSVDIAAVPESVSKSIRIASEATRKRL